MISLEGISPIACKGNVVCAADKSKRLFKV